MRSFWMKLEPCDSGSVRLGFRLATRMGSMGYLATFGENLDIVGAISGAILRETSMETVAWRVSLPADVT